MKRWTFQLSTLLAAGSVLLLFAGCSEEQNAADDHGMAPADSVIIDSEDNVSNAPAVVDSLIER